MAEPNRARRQRLADIFGGPQPTEQYSPASPALHARALREIPPGSETEAGWNTLTYRTPEEETFLAGDTGAGLAESAGAGVAGGAVMAGMREGGKATRAGLGKNFLSKEKLRLGLDRESIPPKLDVDVPTMKKYFERGIKDPRNPNWYTEGKQVGEWLAGEDEPLLRYFGAIFSQRKGPDPETDLAMRAFRLWKERGVGGLRRFAGPSDHQRGELLRGAQSWETHKNPDLLQWELTPGSMKRRDYYGSRGDVDRSVVDVHAGDVATRGEFSAKRLAEDPHEYYGIQHVYHDLADRAGVQRRGYQAAVWVPYREDQAALRGVPAGDPAPAARILLKKAGTNPDWQALIRKGLVPKVDPRWADRLKYGILGAAGAAAAGESVLGPEDTGEDAPMTQRYFR